MIANLLDVIALVKCGWHSASVLVVGDVMLDKYVWGDVERISPEAPVPVVRARLQDEKPGGAANVAMNLAGLGAHVRLVGFSGGDREQRALESLLSPAGVEVSLIAVPAVPTTTKLRVLAGGQQMIRIDQEGPPAFSDADHQHLLEDTLAALSGVSVIVLSDYAKGVLNPKVCQEIIRWGRQLNIPVLVDPKTSSFARYSGATAICPNLKELAAAVGEPATDLDHLFAAAQAQLTTLQVEFMAVTLAEKGISILRPASRVHVPAVVRPVYDVSGAGDTVTAVLALSLSAGIDLETAAQLANIAAGVVVSKVGTVPIRREELLGGLSQNAAQHMDEKVLPLERLLGCVAAWRSQGQRIVFTNGCFDILHIGHIRLLEQARLKGDRLIVGLNSDDSVRMLKGPLRPIVSEEERSRILAALSAVDAVIMFHETSPLRLIQSIRPDVLVKGGDYTEESVIGAREVRAWGGRVELVPIVTGISTTRLFAKFAASAAMAASLTVHSA